jgi:hypothetical protein
VKHITGQELNVKPASDADDVIMEEQLVELRHKVEELSNEVDLSSYYS